VSSSGVRVVSRSSTDKARGPVAVRMARVKDSPGDADGDRQRDWKTSVAPPQAMPRVAHNAIPWSRLTDEALDLGFEGEGCPTLPYRLSIRCGFSSGRAWEFAVERAKGAREAPYRKTTRRSAPIFLRDCVSRPSEYHRVKHYPNHYTMPWNPSIATPIFPDKRPVIYGPSALRP
jgi:hypothetical protein